MKNSSGYFGGLLAPGTAEKPVLRSSLQTSSVLESVEALDALRFETTFTLIWIFRFKANNLRYQISGE